MSHQTKKLAGILMIVLPTVAFGGISLLGLLTDPDSGYMDNPLRQDLWRAGHAHAGVMLILSLVILKYIDEANLPEKVKKWLRYGVPVTALLLPLAFFLSMLQPDSVEPNSLIHLAHAGFIVLTATLIILGIGLLRKGPSRENPTE